MGRTPGNVRALEGQIPAKASSKGRGKERNKEMRGAEKRGPVSLVGEQRKAVWRAQQKEPVSLAVTWSKPVRRAEDQRKRVSLVAERRNVGR